MKVVDVTVAKARELHLAGNGEKLHGRLNSRYLKAAVFGANDGIVTTFAVVAGVTGANLSPAIVIVMGLANMFADALSMGLGDFLGERSEQRYRKNQFAIEEWEVKNIPEEEEKELLAFFRRRNVSDADVKQLTHVIKKYPKVWSELGFIDEMGVTPRFDDQLWQTGLVTFVSFVIAGALPLAPYFVQLMGVPMIREHQITYSVAATASALFTVGSMRTLVTKGVWWKNGLEMLGIGTIAASVAYFIGVFLKPLF